MTKISAIVAQAPATTNANRIQRETGGGFVSNSVLVSASESKQSRFIKLLIAPFKWLWDTFNNFIKMITRTLFCFCNTKRAKEILDWDKAKEAFSKVHTPVISSTAFLTDRTKAYQKALGELGQATTERFYQHIGFAIAAHENPPISDRVDQEKFYNEKCTRQQIRGYLGNIENPILVQAVRSFQKELEEKTKK